MTTPETQGEVSPESMGKMASSPAGGLPDTKPAAPRTTLNTAEQKSANTLPRKAVPSMKRVEVLKSNRKFPVRACVDLQPMLGGGAMKDRITRRDLLKKAAVAGVALSASSIVSTALLARASRSFASNVDPAEIKKLHTGLKGLLILPGSGLYDSARQVWNRRFDKHPAMIVQCAGTEDVVRSIEFARRNNLEVAVRGGGHSMAGLSTCDGGLLIDLSQQNKIHVDPKKRLAQVQPGVTRNELLAATGLHGMVVPMGGCPDTGISGLTLGGGEGDLSGKYGLTLDALESAEIVTADGRILQASLEEHPDLFWGIRGGGGNFGAVTSFRYRLFSLDKVTAGYVAFPMRRAKEIFHFCRETFSNAPDDLMTYAFLSTLGIERVCGIAVCYSGATEHAERTLAPLHSLGRVTASSIRTMTYHDDNQPFDRGIGCHGTGAFIPDLTDEAIDGIIEAMANPPPYYQVGAFPLHGAVTRVPPEATAFPRCEPGFDFFAWASYREPSQEKPTADWVKRFKQLTSKFSKGVYVNNLEDEGAARAKEAYGVNYGRLAALKKQFDPTNLFRLNQNIEPESV